MRAILCYIIFLIASTGTSQTSQIDSLIEALDTISSLSDKARSLNEISRLTFGIPDGKSDEYASRALEISQQNNLPTIQGQAYYMLAYNKYVSGELDSAVYFCELGIKVVEPIDNPAVKSNLYSFLGAVHLNMGESSLAIDPIFKAIEIAEKNELTQQLVGAYNNAGEIYQHTGENENAAIYYQKALDQIRNKAYSVQNELIAVSNLTRVLQDEKKKISLLKEVITNAEGKGVDRPLAYCYISLADIYYENADSISKSIPLFRKSLDIGNEVNDQKIILHANIYLGKALIKIGNVREAYPYIKDGLEMATKFKNLSHKNEAFSALADFYKSTGDYKMASMYQDSALAGFHKEYNDEIALQSETANAKYQNSEKEKQLAEKELELEKQRRTRNQILGGGILISFLIGGIGLWYYQRQKSKKELAEWAYQNEKLEKEKLQELDEMKGQFFTNVSHELKTPLTLILGPISNIIGMVKDQEVKKNLTLAYNNAERLNHLINETLDLAKIEKGKMEVHLEERPIAIDLIRIFLSFTSLAEMRDIQLEGRVPFSDDTYILCDLDKIEKVMNNLVSNAIKFSENGSKVVMNAMLDQELIINIQDYGKGISDHEQEKIFNRFYQASHNRMGSYGGTGIGLAFSKEIAEVLGGSLTVKSKVGEGSRFTFSIPAQLVDQPTIQEEVSWESESLPKEAYQPILIHGERPLILIVEDNKEMQQYLADLLKEDYRCEIAHDGFEALKKIQKSRYHLISSDVMMPNMDGFTLKEKINVFPEHKKTPFIFLTARSMEEDKLSGLRLGVDDYITKPFSKDEYLIRINNLLNNYKERLTSIDDEDPVINIESIDPSILKEAEQLVSQNISNTSFSVGELAEHLHYSQRQLGRILKQHTGLTPVNFILELRLQKAYRMIKSKNYRSVSEVRYEIGIESASYFARKFKERFGISPSEV